MDKHVNHLLQLQELTLIREEHRQTSDGGHLERLEDTIETLTEKLPLPLKGLYARLAKKDRIVIAPVSEGRCAMCGMKLPISQVQMVRRAKEIQNCPNCGRILYESEAPRWIGEKPRRSSPRKGGISRFSAQSLMLPDLAAKTREEAIRALANAMREEGFIDNAEKLVSAALDREAVLSTAVDCGIAFPHVRGVEGGGLTMALGVSRSGIPFDGRNGERSHFIFLTTIPTAVSAFYLKLLAGITEAFTKEPNREALLKSETPEELWKTLNKATRSTVR